MIHGSRPDAFAITLQESDGQVIYWAGQWFTPDAEKASRYQLESTAAKEVQRIGRIGQAPPRRLRIVPHPIQASLLLEAQG